MQEKIKELELLITQLLARQQQTESQNAALKNRIRVLESTSDKLKSADAEARALREWKKNTQTVLKRVAGKIEKELAKAQEEEKEII